MSPARGWLCVCVWMAPESELDGRDEEPEEEGAPRETGQRLPAAKGVDGESHRDDEAHHVVQRTSENSPHVWVRYR